MIALKKQLAKLHAELETARGGTSEQKQDEEEEAVLLPEEKFLSAQPLRIPSYPKRFPGILEAVPEPVAREAVRLIGRLAAANG